MQRIALGIEYDGRQFHGWQAQRGNIRTVQQSLEHALTQVAAHPVRVACAGRTDTGVHALAQVVHFDTSAQRTVHNWVAGTNANLPPDVNVCWAQPVSSDFHARYSAQGRHYRYQIFNRPVRSSLWAGRATWVYRPLDVMRMHQAAQALVGTHDFSSYRARACQAASPVRTLHQIRVERAGELIMLRVHANAFLQHMIRNIAGVLITIGQGERPMSWAAQVLDARNRACGGVTAVPDGLYFAQVDYPAAYNLPCPHPDINLHEPD
jgi:tRNA pseudouridine38-40 synthase